MRAAAPAFRAFAAALWVATALAAPARGRGSNGTSAAVAPRAATGEVAEDAQIAKKILRLTDVQIDRFLTNVDEGRKESRIPGGALDEAGFEERTSQQATALVKLVSKNLKAVGQTLEKFEGALRERKAGQGRKAAEIARLQHQAQELKDSNAREAELVKLRTQNKEMLEDKEGLVKTMQALLGKSQTGKLDIATNSSASRSGAATKEFQKRIQRLEAELAKEHGNEKVLAQQLDAAKQRNQDARSMVERANATNEEMAKENAGLQHSLDQIQNRNDVVITDKGQLMGTLRSLLKQNADLQKQVASAKRVFGMKQPAETEASQLSVRKFLRRTGSRASEFSEGI